MKSMVASAAVITALGLATPALAQSQTSQKDTGTEVQVDQGSPDVTVTQPAPTVTVVDPEPQVKVQTPEPQVSVDQPKPDVQVEEGQPDVTVQQQGQPEVIMKEKSTAATGEPAQDQDGSRQATDQTGQQDSMDQPQQQAGMSQQELEGLVGQAVYDSNGEEAGEISEVLPPQSDGQPLRLVIERGGVLGIGEKRYIVSADQVQMNGEQAQLPMTDDEIAELPRYEEQAQ